jgi:hypothetical protein
MTDWEPVSPEGLAAQKNCHVVATESGGIRGNHFHKLGTEITSAGTGCGPLSGCNRSEIEDGEVYRFAFPPNCARALKDAGSTPNLLVAFNTVPRDPASPDVYRISIEAQALTRDILMLCAGGTSAAVLLSSVSHVEAHAPTWPPRPCSAASGRLFRCPGRGLPWCCTPPARGTRRRAERTRSS